MTRARAVMMAVLILVSITLTSLSAKEQQASEVPPELLGIWSIVSGDIVYPIFIVGSNHIMHISNMISHELEDIRVTRFHEGTRYYVMRYGAVTLSYMATSKLLTVDIPGEDSKLYRIRIERINHVTQN